jgi:hypothetical protein
MELGSATSFDRLIVNGHASLGGQIFIELLPGYIPVAGDSFDLIDWNSISNAFFIFQYPGLPDGLEWNFDEISISGIVSVIGSGLLGDYNEDGFVNAADYTVYRNRKAGIGGTTLVNEGVTPGVVTIEDYEFWESHYGESFGSGATQQDRTADVPEPASLVMLLVGMLPVFSRRRAAVP